MPGWRKINIRETGAALLGPAPQAEKNNGERLSRWCIFEELLIDAEHARGRSSSLPSPTSTFGSFYPYSAVGLHNQNGLYRFLLGARKTFLSLLSRNMEATSIVLGEDL